MLAAHPRSRGENPRMASLRFRLDGSSPLTRGKPPLLRPGGHHRRLIPAHAGKTRPLPRSFVLLTAHPRSRGENSPWPPLSDAPLGSSPLTRGKRHPFVLVAEHFRLIPAHAGKTGPRRSSRSASTAHPRSRGENVGECERRDGGARLIPAHAGKTT